MIVSKSSGSLVSSGGLQDTKTFQIRTNGHAFRMLSSGLYSDKIAAVVREIGCNASDAHIAGGMATKPIEVKLPNSIDPQFYIKDYGIGLDHDEVMGLYSTYFASTKQQSNDMTGAFGLGSKSPFSYTDSFSVTACKNGKRRIYSAHIGKDDTPTVALMHEEPIPANDPWKNGVMVGFPVKKEDIHEFHSRAQKVYRYFPVAPEIIGGDPIKPITVLQDYGSFAFVDEQADPIAVVMGGVKYPLPVGSLGLTGNDVFYTIFHSISNLLLRVPIGCVQVAASREQLQFDEDTRKYLVKALKDAVEVVVRNMVEEAGACKTWQEKCDYVKKAKNTAGVTLSTDLLEYFKIKNANEVMALYNAWNYKLPQPKSSSVRQLLVEESNRSQPSNPSVGFKVRVGRTTFASYGFGSSVRYEPVTIVTGTEDRAVPRVREALKTGVLTGQIIVLCADDPRHPDTAEIKAALKELKKSFEGAPVFDLGTFIAPPLKKTSKSKKKAQVFFDGEIMFDGDMTKVTDIPADRRVYVRATIDSRGNYKYHRKNQELYNDWEWHRICSAIRVIKNKLGITMVEPITLRATELKRVDIHRRPDWVYFDDYLALQLQDKAFMAAVEKYVGEYKYTVPLGRDDYGRASHADFMDVLVWMRANSNHWDSKFKNVVKKHKMLDTVETIYAHSKLPAVPQSQDITSTLAQIGNITDTIGVSLSLPAFTGKDVSKFTKKLEKAAFFDIPTLADLLAKYPNSFPSMLDEVLTRGD